MDNALARVLQNGAGPAKQNAMSTVLGAGAGRGFVSPPVTPGNIDLAKRPVVRNPDGSISTVRSMGINVDGMEYLIPTVSDDGRIMTDDEAIEVFRRTRRHLGAFNNPQSSDAYARMLHDDQARMYVK
jgi:hypothetical protein